MTVAELEHWVAPQDPPTQSLPCSHSCLCEQNLPSGLGEVEASIDELLLDTVGCIALTQVPVEQIHGALTGNQVAVSRGFDLASCAR